MGSKAEHAAGREWVYRVYGLTVASEICLPELTQLDPAASGEVDPIDVRIALGAVPDALPGKPESRAWVEVSDETCLLRFRGIGKFLVESGKRIVVEKDDNASFGDLRGFLVGSALAAAAHQRGLVPLHVSAVVAPRGVVAFTGESGAGKSTMAAHLNHSLNWPLVSDDVSILYRQDDGLFLESGVNTVKLWIDALRSLNRTSEGLRRDLTRFDKFHAVEPEKFMSGRFPLARLILLEWGDELKIERVSGRRAFQVALGAIYRPEFATMFSNRDNVVQAAMEIASAIDIEVLVRPKGAEIETGIAESILSVTDMSSKYESPQ